MAAITCKSTLAVKTAGSSHLPPPRSRRGDTCASVLACPAPCSPVPALTLPLELDLCSYPSGYAMHRLGQRTL